MRVLVTGHLGYIGSVMVPLLQEAGHEVVGLDTGFFDACMVAETPAVTTIWRDLRDVNSADLEGFDAVVHLAALSNDPLGFLDPDLTYHINFSGGLRVAVAAKEAGVKRFLFASSCSLYGAAGSAPADETAPLDPITPYAETKAWLERALLALADDGFSPVMLRNATAHGWSPRLRGDLVVHDLLGSAMSTGKILIKSDGTPWRPLVHVEDITGAAIAALEAPLEVIHAEAFNIGSNEQNFQVRDIAELVAGVVSDSSVTYAPGGEPDKRDYRVDFSKATTTLPGFQPKWTLEASIRHLHGEFIRAGVTHESLTGNRCTRLRRINQLLAEGAVGPDLRWMGSERPLP